MKNNNERIAEYLSGLMKEEERINFERELASSEELQKDYDSAIDRLDKISLSDRIQTNELYFSSMIPRVREKIESGRKFNFTRLVYYIAPAAAAVLILLLYPFNGKNYFDLQYKELANQVVENISDKDVSEKYFTDLETAPSDLMLAGNTEDLSARIPEELEVKNDSYTRVIDSPLADEYRTLDRLSDEQLEIVFKNLKTTSLNR